MLLVSSPINFNECIFQRIDELRLPLVNRFYAACNYNVKCGRAEYVFSLRLQSEMIAAARLMPHVAGHFLLRNLCVAPEQRHKGVASYLISEILATLNAVKNPLSCYCYALPHLQHFYLALGFKYLSVGQVPHDIAETHFRNCARKRGWILMGYVSDLNNDSHKQN